MEKKEKATGRITTITVASLILNIAQAVVIYILEAGPIR